MAERVTINTIRASIKELYGRDVALSSDYITRGKHGQKLAPQGWKTVYSLNNRDWFSGKELNDKLQGYIRERTQAQHK